MVAHLDEAHLILYTLYFMDAHLDEIPRHRLWLGNGSADLGYDSAADGATLVSAAPRIKYEV